jgi:hypothetical protein
MPRRALSVLLARLALSVFVCACSAPDIVQPPTVLVPNAVGRTRVVSASSSGDDTMRARLERVSSGLLYTSESDSPFTWFLAAGPFSPPLNELTVRSALGASPGESVQVLSLDEFFARHIERVDRNDDVAMARVPRYVRLRETLRRSLVGTKVYRVGTIRIRCYAVGFDRHGHLVGLSTISIET